MDDLTGDILSKLVDHMTSTKAYASELSDEAFSVRLKDVVDRAVAVKLKRDRRR